MEKIKDRENLIIKLKSERAFISGMLENNELPKIQLLMLFNFPSEYGLKGFENKASLRSKVYKQIYNSPFLLCDQEHLNPSVKGPFEKFLNNRYVQELEEAYAMFNSGELSIDEYLDACNDLEFCYYKTSEEGEKILEKKRYR